jgi:hypothetical protein
MVKIHAQTILSATIRNQAESQTYDRPHNLASAFALRLRGHFLPLERVNPSVRNSAMSFFATV